MWIATRKGEEVLGTTMSGGTWGGHLAVGNAGEVEGSGRGGAVGWGTRQRPGGHGEGDGQPSQQRPGACGKGAPLPKPKLTKMPTPHPKMGS